MAAGVERVQDEDVGGGDCREGGGQEGGHQERARHPAASGALQRVAARVAMMISLPCLPRHLRRSFPIKPVHLEYKHNVAQE